MENLNINLAADNLPLVTVITVVYNNAIGVKDTIESVRAQTYPHIQYIIIDGGSTDGTVDVIQKYAGDIDYWVSEKDSGIYDAMNKGVAQAKGEWVQFLHAGDIFYSNAAVEQVMTHAVKGDLLYGNAVQMQPDGTQSHFEASDVMSNLWKGALFGHEALFAKANLVKKYPFNLAYGVGADYDFIAHCFKDGLAFVKVPVDVLLFLPPHYSHIHWLQSTMDGWKIARHYFPGIKTDAYYGYHFILSVCVRVFKKILPQKIYWFFQRLYRGLKNA